MRTAMLSIRDSFDRAGILLSGLCAVHCLLSVVLVGGLGLGSQFLLAPWIHRVGLAVAILVGVFSLALGAVRHNRFDNLWIGAIGLGIMGAALVVGHGPSEAALTVCGVTLVAFAHLRNLRLSA